MVAEGCARLSDSVACTNDPRNCQGLSKLMARLSVIITPLLTRKVP